MILRKIPFLLSIYLATMPNCYCSTSEMPEFERNIAGVMQATHQLQKTIKGTILCMTNNTYITVGPPNMFGSTIIVGIPSPTGTIAIKDYSPLPRENMYFFAYEIHQRIETLIAKENALPYSWQADEQLTSSLNNIKKDLGDLEFRDILLQRLLASPSYNTKLSSLAMGKEILAMREDADNLSESLKLSEQEINSGKHNAQSWSVAHRDRNWK